MKRTTPSGDETVHGPGTDVDHLRPLVVGRTVHAADASSPAGLLVGELIGIRDDGRTALVIVARDGGSAAMPARSVVDLHGAHIGRQVVLMLENADPAKPVVMGVLRDRDGWPLDERPGQVEVEADGERVIVSAREQLVLKCGKASITLTRAGKVLIEGTYVSSRSSGVNRVKGGSVQLN